MMHPFYKFYTKVVRISKRTEPWAIQYKYQATKALYLAEELQRDAVLDEQHARYTRLRRRPGVLVNGAPVPQWSGMKKQILNIFALWLASKECLEADTLKSQGRHLGELPMIVDLVPEEYLLEEEERPVRLDLGALYTQPFNVAPNVAPRPNGPLPRPHQPLPAAVVAAITAPNTVSSAPRRRNAKAARKAGKKAAKKSSSIMEDLANFVEPTPKAPGSIDSKASSAFGKLGRVCSPPGKTPPSKTPIERYSSQIKRVLDFSSMSSFKRKLEEKKEEVKGDGGPQYASPSPTKKSPTVPASATSSYFCAKESPPASVAPRVVKPSGPKVVPPTERQLRDALLGKTKKVAKKVSEETQQILGLASSALDEIKDLRRDLLFANQALEKANKEIASLKEAGRQRDARLVDVEEDTEAVREIILGALTAPHPPGTRASAPAGGARLYTGSPGRTSFVRDGPRRGESLLGQARREDREYLRICEHLVNRGRTSSRRPRGAGDQA